MDRRRKHRQTKGRTDRIDKQKGGNTKWQTDKSDNTQSKVHTDKDRNTHKTGRHNGRTKGSWTDKSIDRQNRLSKGQRDKGWKGGHTGKRTYRKKTRRQTKGWTDKRTDGKTKGWTD